MNEQPMHQSNYPPPNYLVWAILTTVFCCPPFGIVSIVYAANVNSKWSAGDYEGAGKASRNAQIWAWVAFGSGIVIGLISMLLSILGAFAGFLTQGFEF